MPNINSLTYNGTKSTDLGVYVTGSGSFDSAEFDVDKYEIPGRNGDLILSNNRYKNIEITYPAFIPKAFMDKVQNVRNWLRSSSVYARLEDTYDMDHYRLGIPTGVQSFSPENRNDGANFEMTFDCKPQRFLKVGETPETVEAETKTASGEIASFDSIAVVPMTSAEVSLSPIQSGSGDPSPTNIRPISGHTGAELIRTGKNLLNVSASGVTNGYIDAAGVFHTSTLWTVSDFIPVETGKPYVLSGLTAHPNSNIDNYLTYDENKNYIGVVNVNVLNQYPKEFGSNVHYVKFCLKDTDSSTAMFEQSSSATAYEPYEGDTYSVTFTDQGTVYGGTYDFVTGKLRVTRKIITLDGSQPIGGSQNNRFYVSISDAAIVDASNQTTYQGVISEILPTTSWAGLGNRDGCSPVWGHGVAFKSAIYTSASEWKTYFTNNPTTFSYELATPLEYTLSPQQLTTLQGQNVVWGAGPITLTYAEPYKVENPTLFDARPLFTVTNPAEGDVIMVNGQAITFVDGYTGTVYIDCETMNAFSGAANLNSIIQATDFPVLVPGTNIITWTGAGACTITPRWWEL